jgi:glycosyltransferase involved in cell wall biosynthesis
MYFPQMYKPLDRKIYYRKFLYASRTADRIVAISNKTKEDIVKYLHVDPAKISVVYQGCHPAFHSPDNIEVWKSLKNDYNIPQDYLLYVGAINERKNALTLVKSLQHHHYPLVLVGSGKTYYHKVQQEVKRAGLTKRVRFLQGLKMEQIASLYKHARIFIYPSLFEGFGIPIIESLYSRTPVITTAGGVFPEAGGPDSIYLKNPLNEEEIAEQTIRLWEDSGLREYMVEKGYQYAQKFNDETIAGNWHHVYNELRQ